MVRLVGRWLASCALPSVGDKWASDGFSQRTSLYRTGPSTRGVKSKGRATVFLDHNVRKQFEVILTLQVKAGDRCQCIAVCTLTWDGKCGVPDLVWLRRLLAEGVCGEADWARAHLLRIHVLRSTQSPNLGLWIRTCAWKSVSFDAWVKTLLQS